MIGNTKVECVLLDLSASVNLLPFFVYEHLGLGELKSISATLQLVDRLVKISRGVVEYVLGQIDKFYFHILFQIPNLKYLSF